MSAPDLSIMVATSQRRRPFWPWLAADIARQGIFQQGMNAEVLVCDGAREERPDSAAAFLRRELGAVGPAAGLPVIVRHVPCHYATHGEIAAKRQALIEAASGAFACWMDDDDYHHPDWTSMAIAQLLVRGNVWHSFSGVVYYDVMHDRHWVPKNWSRHPIPIMTVTRGTPLDMDLSKNYAEDVDWFQRLSVFKGQVQALSAPAIMALVHPFKTSTWLLEPRTQEAFKPGLPPFLEPDGGALEAELKLLRSRLHAASNIREITSPRRKHA